MENSEIILSTGDYQKLLCYQKAEVIFDITYYFVHKFLKRGDRTIDQMQQAARSGKQNIAEGYTRGGTSAKTAIILIDVAKSSLIELYNDYCDYQRTREHIIWEKQSKEWLAMRELARKHNDSAYYMGLVKTRPPETIANMSICLLKQTDFLLARLLQSMERQFKENGGFHERMTRARIETRKKNDGGKGNE